VGKGVSLGAPFPFYFNELHGSKKATSSSPTRCRRREPSITRRSSCVIQVRPLCNRNSLRACTRMRENQPDN